MSVPVKSGGHDSILWLDDLEPEAAHEAAGSKIGRLAELARAGLEVPTGFVVTTHAFRSFFATSGVEAAVERELAGLDAQQLGPVTAASQRLRDMVDASPLPEPITEAITGAYDELSYRRRQLRIPVAVRSSAVREDAADASCAGQFESFLGVSGADAVAAAVKRCWASLFGSRAILYLLSHGLALSEFPMAVGVLELVDARSSGVGFSIHPVTGNRERVVIEGSWGWGEAVVQGLVTPDHVEVSKDDRRILRHDVADKAVVSAFDPSGGRVVEIETPARFRQRPSLDTEEIGAIADAIVRIESHYGHPVDIEWVIDRRRRPGEPVTIVQARPETVHSAEEPATCSPVWDPAAYAAKYAFGRKR